MFDKYILIEMVFTSELIELGFNELWTNQASFTLSTI